MPLANETLQLLAARRFAKALQGDAGVERVLAAGESILEELRRKLSPVIGPLGYQALMSRALMAARPKHPWLAAARADAGGRLVEVAAAMQGVGAVELLAGFLALVCHLLILLERLIGDDLTSWVVSQIWPDESLEPVRSNTSERQS